MPVRLSRLPGKVLTDSGLINLVWLQRPPPQPSSIGFLSLCVQPRWSCVSLGSGLLLPMSLLAWRTHAADLETGLCPLF